MRHNLDLVEFESHCNQLETILKNEFNKLEKEKVNKHEKNQFK